MARLGAVLGVLASAYLVYAVAMIWLHPRFIYPFDQRAFEGDGFQTDRVPVAGDAPVQVLVSRAQAVSEAPVVVYFMGNLGAAEIYRAMLEHHGERGRHVVVMTYRGGGGVPGTPSEARLKSDALAVIDWTRDTFPGPLFLHGYSMGTGLAVHGAANRAVAGVVLSAPYRRMCDLMARAAWLPACLLPGVQGWKSTRVAGQIQAPVLILHGAQDTLIPPRQSELLAEAMEAGSVRVTREVFPEAGHDGLMGVAGYLDAIDRFLEPK